MTPAFACTTSRTCGLMTVAGLDHRPPDLLLGPHAAAVR